MTSTSDFITDSRVHPRVEVTLAGASMVLLAMQRLIGFSLILAASGLWLTPNANWGSDVLLMKMGLSIVSLIVGFWLVFADGKSAQPDVEIDTVRRELRFVGSGPMGARFARQRIGFAELSQVERSDEGLKFWDSHGKLIADMYVTERSILDALVSGLRDSGHEV